MKNKFFLLSTMISSCLFTIASSQSTAQDLNPNVPNSGKQRCYPASKCTGDPNLIGGNRGYAGNQQAPSQNSGINNQYYGGNQNYGGNQRGYSYNGGAAGVSGAPSGKVLQTESTEKFTGVVQSVNRVALPNQTQIQIVLSTDHGDMLVIVGPASFVDQAKIKLQAGDKVEVTGYRVTANGNDVILAAQIQRNGNILQLLDENRKPLWGPAPGMQGGGIQNPGMQGGANYYQGSQQYSSSQY